MKAIQRLMSASLFLYIAVTIACLPFIAGYYLLTDGEHGLREGLNFILNGATKAFLAFAVFHSLIPFSILLRSILKDFPSYEKCNKSHPIYKLTKETAEKMDMRTPHVFVVGSKQPNAFAFSTPFASGTCVTAGLLDLVDSREELGWIIAHELSHIRNNDSLSHAWYICSVNTVHRFLNALSHIYMRISNTFCSALSILLPRPLAVVLCTFLVGTIGLLLTSQALLIRFSRVIFDVIDRQIDREMEYRCDYDAAKIYGGHYGVSILNKLPSGIEPSFGNLMATHPTNKSRIDAVKSVKAKGRL